MVNQQRIRLRLISVPFILAYLYIVAEMYLVGTAFDPAAKLSLGSSLMDTALLIFSFPLGLLSFVPPQIFNVINTFFSAVVEFLPYLIYLVLILSILRAKSRRNAIILYAAFVILVIANISGCVSVLNSHGWKVLQNMKF